MHNDSSGLEGAAELRVTLVGGPLDGWPVLVCGSLPEELRLPYSREMLELAARSPASAVRKEWSEIRFPSADDADGVAVYRPGADCVPTRPVFQFAGLTG